MKKFTFFLISLILGTIFFGGCDLVDELVPDDTDTTGMALGDTLWTLKIVADGDNSTFIPGYEMALSQDEKTVYFAANAYEKPAHIFAVNREEGTVKWVSEKLFGGLESAIVVADDGTLYATSHRGHVYSINPAYGSFNWVYVGPDTIKGQNGLVYVTNNDATETRSLVLTNEGNLVFKTPGCLCYTNGIWCINPQGELLWYRLDEMSGLFDMAIGHDGTLYDIEGGYGDESRFVALDTQTGEVKWSITGINNPYGPSVIDDNDNVYFYSFDTLECINTRTHKVVWKNFYDGIPLSYTLRINQTGDLLSNLYGEGHIIDPSNGFEENTAAYPFDPLVDSKNRFIGIMGAPIFGIALCTEEGEKIWDTGLLGNFMPCTFLLTSDKKLYGFSNNILYAYQYDATLAHSGWPRYTHDNRNTHNASKW